MNISKLVAPYGKSIMPILAHAMVNMKQGVGTLTVTDIETRLTIKLRQSEKIDRAFMVPIKELSEKFKGVKNIRVTDTGLADVSGSIHCSLNETIAPEDFPLKRTMKEPVEVQIKDTQVFFDILKQTLLFYPKHKIVSEYANCLFITYGEGDTEIVATDVFNLIRFRTDSVVLPDNAPFKFSRQRISKHHLGGFLLPAAAIKRLLQIYDRKKPLECVVYNQEYAVFDDGTAEFTVRLPKPEMPVYDTALERAGCYGDEYLVIDPGVILKDLSKFLAEHRKDNVVTVLYDHTDTITLRPVITQEEDSVSWNYPAARITGIPGMGRIALNGVDLERALKVPGTDRIRWESGELTPIALKGTCAGYKFDIIIMPVRFWV